MSSSGSLASSVMVIHSAKVLLTAVSSQLPSSHTIITPQPLSQGLKAMRLASKSSSSFVDKQFRFGTERSDAGYDIRNPRLKDSCAQSDVPVEQKTEATGQQGGSRPESEWTFRGQSSAQRFCQKSLGPMSFGDACLIPRYLSLPRLRGPKKKAYFIWHCV